MRMERIPGTSARILTALGIATLAAGPARAADIVVARVPFAFSAGPDRLPAGQYRFTVDRDAMVVTIEDVQAAKTSFVRFVTPLGRESASNDKEARLVFERDGDGGYALSDFWVPEAGGFQIEPAVPPGQAGNQIAMK